jgi:hypothetical protein
MLQTYSRQYHLHRLLHQRYPVEPNQHHRKLLSQLSLNQLEEALLCLHQDRNPQDKHLQSLQLKEWSLLHQLLVMLMLEKEQSSLH